MVLAMQRLEDLFHRSLPIDERGEDQVLTCELRSHSSKPMWPRRASPIGTSERSSARPPRPIGHPREAGVCSSTSALNGRWRLISAMYACTREGPYKIPCAIDTRKAREAGVFDVRY